MKLTEVAAAATLVTLLFSISHVQRFVNDNNILGDLQFEKLLSRRIGKTEEITESYVSAHQHNGKIHLHRTKKLVEKVGNRF